MVAEVVAGCVCVGVLVLTALAQRPKLRLVCWLKSHDSFALIPTWTFFAPNPGTTDTRILWRERLLDGSVSQWHEVEPPTGGFLRAIWNPSKRVRKALTDVGQILTRRASQQPDNRLLLVSMPFLMLLHYVSSLPASPLVEARQFVIVQTFGCDEDENEPRIMLVSNWHALQEQEVSTPAEPAPEVARQAAVA